MFHILVQIRDCLVCVILDIHRSSSNEGIWLVRSVLQWCHNKHDGISNHRHHDCLLNHLLRGISKKKSKLHITGLCQGNSLVAGELPTQRASNMENVSIWWRHHGNFIEKFCWTTSQRELARKLTDMEFSVKITILFQQIVSNRLSSNHVIMPPPLGAEGFMFSGCPSVRPSVQSLKYPLLTCTWVRWSTRPTVTVLRHVRPSVRPSGEVSGHLLKNAWRDLPEILHADVSWPSSELISLWSWSVDFANFGTILT